MRAALILLASVAIAQVAPPKPKASPKPAAASPKTAKPQMATSKPMAIMPVTDEEKTIYALGLSIHRSLSKFDLSPHELDIVKQALADAAAGKPAVDLDTWGPKIQPLARERSSRVVEHEKASSQAYIDKAATESGAEKTTSGLVYREVRPGTGASPQASDTVKVNYRGTLVNGTEFDSSYSRNEPAQFSLSGVIPCWTEGLQKMKTGGKAVLVCPSNLAYGDDGRPSIPGGAALIFEIELLEIIGSKP
jgi:FKBP-type peptidyl-prolyl cis-trans isomerase FkpA